MTKRVAPILFVSFLLMLAGCPKSSDSGAGSGSGTTPPPNPTTTKAARHEACSDTTPCDTGLDCVSYNGIAGNELRSCEMRCDGKEGCPTGEHCGVVADGPRDVCIHGDEPGTGSGGTGALPKQTEACPDDKCDTGLTCVSYYGIAGTRGPKFTSCEIPCKGGAACPNGQKCITVADGPGQVCRPQP
jgi:hypothetical protein